MVATTLAVTAAVAAGAVRVSVPKLTTADHPPSAVAETATRDTDDADPLALALLTTAAVTLGGVIETDATEALADAFVPVEAVAVAAFSVTADTDADALAFVPTEAVALGLVRETDAEFALAEAFFVAAAVTVGADSATDADEPAADTLAVASAEADT